MSKLTAAKVKEVAKELKIPKWWTLKMADLVSLIAEAKGISHEPLEVQHYLIGGGKITVGNPPGQVNQKPTREDQAMKPQRRTLKSKKEKLKGETTHREAPKGFVTLAQLCADLGIDGKAARRILRASDLQKPGKSWTWKEGSAELTAAKNLLSK